MHGAYDVYKCRNMSIGTSDEQKIVEDHVELCSRLQNSKLPRTLRYPTEKAQPWFKWSFDEDFVLLAEFSEDEGPRPVVSSPAVSHIEYSAIPLTTFSQEQCISIDMLFYI